MPFTPSTQTRTSTNGTRPQPGQPSFNPNRARANLPNAPRRGDDTPSDRLSRNNGIYPFGDCRDHADIAVDYPLAGTQGGRLADHRANRYRRG